MRWELCIFLLGAVAIPLGCLLPFRWLRALPNDKLLHFIAFGSMALLGGRLVSGTWHIVLVLLGVLAASWLIEVLQNLVPGRRFCWRDMAANAAGIVCAGACLAVMQPA